MKILRIFTDGACSGNQNQENTGGWGAVLEYGDAKKELYGGEINTTNNRMEMTALLAALDAIKKPGQRVEIFSDSSYLMECFRERWYEKWRLNGWKTTARKPVENKDLWEKLLQHLDHHAFKFYRVKGHVDLNSKSLNFEKLYEKFLEWNGPAFSIEDFKYITEMNNRADALANMGIDEIRKEAK